MFGDAVSILGYDPLKGGPYPITDIRIVNRLGQEIQVNYTIRNGVLVFTVGRRGEPSGIVAPNDGEVLKHGS